MWACSQVGGCNSLHARFDEPNSAVAGTHLKGAPAFMGAVTASVYQMMRGAEMLFAALFAVVFLKRRWGFQGSPLPCHSSLP